jgi:hypothetical protein
LLEVAVVVGAAADAQVTPRGKVISLHLVVAVVVADRALTVVVGLAGDRFLRVHLPGSIFRVLGGHRARPREAALVVRRDL